MYAQGVRSGLLSYLHAEQILKSIFLTALAPDFIKANPEDYMSLIHNPKLGDGLRGVMQFLVIVFVIGTSLRAVPQQAAVNDPNRRTLTKVTSDTGNALEIQKLELERQKFIEATAAEEERARIEWAKLEFEKSNASRLMWTSMGPLLGSLLAIALGIVTLGIQVRLQKKIQELTAELQFEIKAAEIAFAGKTPAAVKNRAGLLKKIFPDRLPKNFVAESFEPTQYGGKTENSESKKQFLELLAKYPDQQKMVYDVWKALFEEDWIEKIKPLIQK